MPSWKKETLILINFLSFHKNNIKMSSNTEMNQAIAELAYAMCIIDGELHKDEKKAFLEIIKSELGEGEESAKIRFELLDEITNPNMEHAYQDALNIIRFNKHQLNEDLKNRFIRVIERVAISHKGMQASENIMIKKFKQDLKDI